MQENRWEAIAASIKGAIRRGELHMGARIASETELAAQWSVSPMTVHRALSELQREGWVMRRRKAGTVVADRSTHPITKIGLVVDSMTAWPQGGYARGIEEGLADGYQMVPYLRSSTVSEALCLERAAAECSAVICHPTGSPASTPIQKKIASSMPLLFIDCEPENGVGVDVVCTDHSASLQMGLRHLLGQGHRRIAYLMTFPHSVSSQRERLAAYLDFVASGHDDPEELVRRFPAGMPEDLFYNRIEATIVELLSGDRPITAIACQQDLFSSTAIEACIRLGISIPDELAILGFVEQPQMTQPFGRSIYRLVQRAPELGRLAAERIKLRSESPTLPPQRTTLLTDFYPAASYTPSDAARTFIARSPAVKIES